VGTDAKKIQLTYADLRKLVSVSDLVLGGVTLVLPLKATEDDLGHITEIIDDLDTVREDLEDEVSDDVPDSEEDLYDNDDLFEKE